MTWKRILFPVAAAWTLVNVAGLGIAVAAAEWPHALVHVVFIGAFGWATSWLWRRPQQVERDARIDVLENEVSDLQRQLSETQEGLTFAEQLLAQRKPARDAEFQPRAGVRRAQDDHPGP